MDCESITLSDLSDVPSFGRWFESLTALMSDGNPPVVRFDTGEVIMRAGEPADCFLVILHGAAEVLGTFGDVASLAVGPGALLGELGVLFEGRRRRTVIATAPTVALTGSREELEAAQQVEEIGAHAASVAGRRLAEQVEPIPATTPNGFPVLLRPLLPSDREAYLELFGRVSLETLYKRFFMARRPLDAVIERLLYVDFVDHFAWIATHENDSGGDVIGIVRLVVERDDPSAAEIAFAVVDEHQGRGLGSLLLAIAGAWAEARRLATITAHVLAENRAARGLFGKANARWSRSDEGVLRASLSVPDASACSMPAPRAAWPSQTGSSPTWPAWPTLERIGADGESLNQPPSAS